MCNGCNGVSLGDHGVPEGDRIPSLKPWKGVGTGRGKWFPWIIIIIILLLLLLL